MTIDNLLNWLQEAEDNNTFMVSTQSVKRHLEKIQKEQLILSGVVKCNCDESEQLEEEFEIHHLINDTYQVIGKDSNTVWKQGTLEDCNEFVML
jgi:hypothetical protein